MAPGFLFLCLYLARCLAVNYAQLISTNTPVPPIQWINLSHLLQGSSAPPPLRDAALGYDDSSRSLIIFGGESEGGFVQSQTFLLNLNNLTWSIPSPPVNLATTPSARSSAISALDFAASNRHSFVVIGGKGPNNVALSDVWAYDFTNQFWSQVNISPGGPSPRWGAVGGIDLRSATIQDPILPGPNNSFFLAGGVDNGRTFPLSDVWRLNLSGTLSANLPDSVLGSWEQITLPDSTLPGHVRQGGHIIGQQIISMGGCNITMDVTNYNSSCARQDSYVIDTQRRSSISPGPCPAPRLDPVVVPNFNAFSSSFASQAFLALGTFNTSLWDDGKGSEKGEIDILDINTGSWSRILPAGDPGTSGQVTYPTPREGAAAFSFNRALVGSIGGAISDTIIFGGRDATGKYLSEMWLLRTYSGSLSSSSSTWTGFGDGRLRSGVNADGSGVSVRYLTQCAVPIAQSGPNNGDGGSSPAPPGSPSGQLFDTNLSHKLLSPLSLALLLLSLLLLRVLPSPVTKQYQIWLTLAISLTAGAYAVGVAGFVFAFTSFISLRPGAESESSSSQHWLSTPHGKGCFIFFICLYVLVPILMLISFGLRKYSHASDTESQTAELRRQNSVSTAEKLDHIPMTSHSPAASAVYSPPASPPRIASWGPSNPPTRRSLEAMSSDGESVVSGTLSPHRGFEVLNRPARARKPSETAWSASLGHISPPPMASSSRSLGEIDWLLRRRTLNAVGDLDYAIGLAENNHRNAAANQLPTTSSLQVLEFKRPPALEIAAYILAQVSLLGLSIITLIALWSHAPKAIFAVFLVWVAAFYTLLIFVPRRFQSEAYLLSMLSRSGRGTTGPGTLNPDSSAPDLASPLPSQGPYLHQPPFLRTVPADNPYISGGRRNPDDDDDEAIDDDMRQRMMEEEMGRRDVSIVTVPKRKLCVVNPS